MYCTVYLFDNSAVSHLRVTQHLALLSALMNYMLLTMSIETRSYCGPAARMLTSR